MEKSSRDSEGEVLLLCVLLSFAGLLPQAVPLENIKNWRGTSVPGTPPIRHP